MKFVWITAVRDFRRRLRDPLALVLWVGIPFVILLLLTFAFGGGGEIQPQAHLLVADEDESVLSGLLIAALGQGPLAEVIRVERVDRDAGQRRMDEGGASALLVIPDGFGSGVLEERPVTLELVTNPAQQILPGIVEETLGTFVDAVFYLQRLLAEPLRVFWETPADGITFPDETIASFSVLVNRLVDRTGTYLFPPVIELEVETVETERPTVNLGALFFQSMFFMSLMFMAGGMSDEPWLEKAHGTLRRVATTPRRLTEFLAGKLLAGALLIGAVSTVGLGAGFAFYGVEPARLPLSILWTTFSGTLLLSIFSLIQVYATSQRTGGILANVVLFPLMLTGGNFFPFEAMPTWLASFGQWTPNGWALTQFKRIASGTADLAGLAGAFAALAALGTILFLLTARRIRRAFVQA